MSRFIDEVVDVDLRGFTPRAPRLPAVLYGPTSFFFLAYYGGQDSVRPKH